ncbi:TetR/AcrR family transcriptional regulator [Prolixibacteraceae bacterium]|nr:TetR/AcrR family transcriptional regulator [Prolixibacteraceae bacterium]
MPRTEEQNKTIRVERKQQIMGAAMRLFSEKNPAEVSIATIAKEAGVSKGLMYSYFKSKDELELSIMNSTIDEIMEIFLVSNKVIEGPDDFTNRINRLFDHVINNVATWKIYTQLILQSKMKEFLMSPKIQDVMGWYQEQLFNYLQKQGFEDPAKEIIIVGALIDGISIQYVSAPEFIDINIVRNHILDVYAKKY